MGIRSTYRLGGELFNIIIDGTNLMFLNSSGTITTIDGVRISKGGVIKEFPELENNPEWKKIAIERLKEKIKSLQTEMERTNYVKDELVKFGYEAMFYQRAGHRPSKFK